MGQPKNAGGSAELQWGVTPLSCTKCLFTSTTADDRCTPQAFSSCAPVERLHTFCLSVFSLSSYQLWQEQPAPSTNTSFRNSFWETTLIHTSRKIMAAKHTSTLQVTTRQNQTFGASYAPHNHDDICLDNKLNRKSDLTEGGNEHAGSRNRKYAERERHKGIVRQPC